MTERIIKALSIRAPWWWFILHGGKDIENRNWNTNYRGWIYIHASKRYSQRDVSTDIRDATHVMHQTRPHLNMPNNHAFIKMFGGHLVGRAQIVDCVTESASPWFFGR